MVIIFTRLGGAKRWGEILKSSYNGQVTKGEGPIFMVGVDPSIHRGIDKYIYILLIKYIFLIFFHNL